MVCCSFGGHSTPQFLQCSLHLLAVCSNSAVVLLSLGGRGGSRGLLRLLEACLGSISLHTFVSNSGWEVGLNTICCHSES